MDAGGGRNHKFVPVFLEEIDIRSLPSFLRGYQYFSVQDEYEDLHRLLTHRSPRNAKPQLGVVSAPPAKITTRSVQASVARAPRVSIARLPSTSPVLVGRQTELSQLDKLWHSRELGLVTILAPGGAGKSALVNAWLSTLRRKKWAGALRVFGWSFYRQGRQGTSQESADLFLANALSWFGDPHPETGETWDKGERLAELVRARRTLLILDGLEPLQSAPSGKLNDPGVEALLRQLATTNCGLCVVSSRLEIDALKDFDTAIMRLDRLSEEAGCELLSKLGVKGIVDELRDAVNEFRGHALALSLLGSYLEAAYGGDVRRRREISSLASEPDMGSHAQRVIESYEVWFQGRPELEVLRLMGLFDRPVEPGALAALLDGPPIQELTDQLQRLSHDGWGFVLKNLRRARLLDPGSNNRLDSLDCHPLIREHFAKKLRETAGSSWRKANKRLFDYYRSTTQEHPDTTGDMSRLYAAVVHGCQAGLFNEAFESVYWSRIQRGRQFASSRKLGMFGADLLGSAN